MSVGVTTPVAEHDPVRAALADPAVGDQLLAAARASLGPRGFAQDAADVAHKAVERVLARGHRYDPDRDVVSWLVGFVVNVAREHVRRLGRSTTGPFDPPHLESLAADLGRPVAEVVADQEAVARLLDQLPPADREIVRLVYFEGMTFAEVGARVGVTEAAARVRHFRLLKQLRELAGGGEVRS